MQSARSVARHTRDSWGTSPELVAPSTDSRSSHVAPPGSTRGAPSRTARSARLSSPSSVGSPSRPPSRTSWRCRSDARTAISDRGGVFSNQIKIYLLSQKHNTNFTISFRTKTFVNTPHFLSEAGGWCQLSPCTVAGRSNFTFLLQRNGIERMCKALCAVDCTMNVWLLRRKKVLSWFLLWIVVVWCLKITIKLKAVTDFIKPWVYSYGVNFRQSRVELTSDLLSLHCFIASVLLTILGLPRHLIIWKRFVYIYGLLVCPLLSFTVDIISRFESDMYAECVAPSWS